MNQKYKKISSLIIFFLVFLGSSDKKVFSAQNGMTFDVSFDYGLSNVKSDLFKIKSMPAALVPAVGAVPDSPAFAHFNFEQEFDFLYGGNILFGYMMESGVGASVGLGYHQSKIKDKKNKETDLKPVVFSGMINIDYAFDLGTIFYPYFSIGAGLGRIDMKGLINGNDGATPPENVTLEFKNLKKNKFVYQAGAGILIKNFGVGYKFFGMFDLEDTDTFNDLKLNLTSNAGNEYDVSSNGLQFGTFENKNHMVTAFMKFVI